MKTSGRVTPVFLPLAALGISLLISPIVQGQALTPDQLTRQVKSLGVKAENTEMTLGNIEQEVQKLYRMIDNRAVLELFQKVDVLADEISQLRGEIEQQTNDLSGIKKRQRELYLDIDRRLRDLENRASAQTPAVAPIDISILDSLPEPVLPGTTGTAAGTTGTAAPQPTTGSSQVSGTTSSEERAAYQAAFDTLKEGRYKKAKAEFKRFLNQYPGSSFAGNAQYWLGEAHYVTRRFEQGIVEFGLVLKIYPNSSKVPDAMLKLGYTYYELKQFEQAKSLLLELRKRYPKSTAFRLAGKRLDRIRKEGY
ncbi:MAG: tol-pal system protein YbgF [Proteobacteria bacterium]|nr:tol-pal system protein YbgF [Pseudomonadota bacterium]